MDIKHTLMRCIRFFVNVFKEKKIMPYPVLTNSSNLLEGKIALITGGSSGIGYSIAKAFVKSGARVIIAARDEDKMRKCCEELGGDKSRYIFLDISKIELLDKKIKEAIQLFDDNKIDILVNSAGVLAKNDLFSMTEEEWDIIMDTNAKGVYFLTRIVAKNMIENEIKGHILNVTSSSALRPAWTPYQLSKWVVEGLTMGLADILIPYGITVNAIAPGPTATPMMNKKEDESIFCTNPAGRYVMPDEIANIAVMLASDLGNMIIGNTVYVTGGSGTISMHS